MNEAEILLRALFNAIQEKEQVKAGGIGLGSSGSQISDFGRANAKLRLILIEVATFLHDKYIPGMERST